MPTSLTPLSTLRRGAVGVVQRMADEDHAMLIRLKTMGLVEGRAVRVLRTGSRMIVACGGTRIGLAREVAEHVQVQMQVQERNPTDQPAGGVEASQVEKEADAS